MLDEAHRINELAEPVRTVSCSSAVSATVTSVPARTRPPRRPIVCTCVPDNVYANDRPSKTTVAGPRPAERSFAACTMAVSLGGAAAR